MKTKLTTILASLFALVGLSQNPPGPTIIGNMKDIFGSSYSPLPYVRFIPGTNFVAVGTNTYFPIPRPAQITNGQFTVQLVGPVFYDADFGPGLSRIRILAPADTNTYTFNFCASLAVNVGFNTVTNNVYVTNNNFTTNVVFTNTLAGVVTNVTSGPTNVASLAAHVLSGDKQTNITLFAGTNSGTFTTDILSAGTSINTPGSITSGAITGTAITAASLNASGSVTASSFNGAGSGITGLPSTSLTGIVTNTISSIGIISGNGSGLTNVGATFSIATATGRGTNTTLVNGTNSGVFTSDSISANTSITAASIGTGSINTGTINAASASISAGLNTANLTASGTMSGNGSGITNLAAAGLTYYVSTNGNAATARANEPGFPFPPDFSQAGYLYTHTSPGDVIKINPGHYLVTNVFINQGVTFEGLNMPWFTTSTNCSAGPGTGGCAFGVSTFQPLDNVTIRGIFWESTNIWTTNSAPDGGIFNSFMMGGYYFPTNVLIENCRLFGGSDIFYGNAFGTPDVIVRNCVIESFWDLAKFTPGYLRSFYNKWINHSWGNTANPTVNGSININFSDSHSKFYGFNGGELIGSRRLEGSEFYLGTNALNMAAWSGNVQPGGLNGGYYYDDYLQAVVSVSPDGGTYLTNSLTTNTVNNFNTNIFYVTGLTTVAAMNRGYTNQSLITSNGISGPGSTFLVTGVGVWTNSTYTLTLNDPIATNLACSLGLTAPCDAVGIWGLKTNSNGGYAYIGDLGQIPFPPGAIGDPFFCIANSGIEGQWAEATNSTTTNITPNVFPALFGGQISTLSNRVSVSVTTSVTTNLLSSFAGNTNGVFYKSNALSAASAMAFVTNNMTNGGFWIGIITNTLETVWMSNNVVQSKRIAP